MGWVCWLRVPMGLVAVARLKPSAGQLSGPRQAQASPTVKKMTEMRYVDLFFKACQMSSSDWQVHFLLSTPNTMRHNNFICQDRLKFNAWLLSWRQTSEPTQKGVTVVFAEKVPDEQSPFIPMRWLERQHGPTEDPTCRIRIGRGDDGRGGGASTQGSQEFDRSAASMMDSSCSMMQLATFHRNLCSS